MYLYVYSLLQVLSKQSKHNPTTVRVEQALLVITITYLSTPCRQWKAQSVDAATCVESRIAESRVQE